MIYLCPLQLHFIPLHRCCDINNTYALTEVIMEDLMHSAAIFHVYAKSLVLLQHPRTVQKTEIRGGFSTALFRAAKSTVYTLDSIKKRRDP